MNPNNKYKNLKVPGTITTPFGGKTRDEPVHPGVDFANKPGAPIQSFADGVVTGVGGKGDGSGNVVILKDKNGDVHQYGHLQNQAVKKNQIIKKGDKIGTMGASGNSYSPTGGDATHLDIRIAGKDGTWRNPMNYLRKTI